jgi:DNA ligase-1
MPEPLMRAFAELCEAIAATPSKTEKVAKVAAFLARLDPDAAALSAIFLSGRLVPRHDSRPSGVRFSLVIQAVVAICGEEGVATALRRHGDLGGMAEELLEGRAGEDVPMAELSGVFEALVRDRTAAGKVRILRDFLARLRPVEAKYAVKVLVGDLRIGLQESLVEEAIARAFEARAEDVQRANMLTSDLGQTVRLARDGRLARARLRLFHPVSFMLASPAESAADALEAVGGDALVEDKFDGIRAQAHVGGGRAMLFSRNLEEASEFPELLEPLRALAGEAVLDGEIVGVVGERSLPFTAFQRRLGRRQKELFIADEIPVRFWVFDLLYQDGEMLLDLPLLERRGRLSALVLGADAALLRSVGMDRVGDAPSAEAAFEAALARGNEGIMLKDPRSPYRPGRRGRAWMKLKRPLATLDVVVTGVEYGHGKRAGVLSDYTFSVRDEGGLKTLGKAFTGLTDKEIAELTPVFLEATLEERGGLRRVRPEIVLEVAFNNIQPSKRHESGYALRFPRIVRLRPDKAVSEIDTLERVVEIYRQGLR